MARLNETETTAATVGRVVTIEFATGLPAKYDEYGPCGLMDCECPDHEDEAKHPKPEGTYVTLRLDHNDRITLGSRLALTPEASA